MFIERPPLNDRLGNCKYITKLKNTQFIDKLDILFHLVLGISSMQDEKNVRRHFIMQQTGRALTNERRINMNAITNYIHLIMNKIN